MGINHETIKKYEVVANVLKAEIICIGTELLLGQIVDTNATFLAKELADLGIDLHYKSTVGDNLGRMVEVLDRSWNRSEILILSGGLGPTQDDLTREAVAKMLGEKLEFNQEAWEQIKAYFHRMGRPITENNQRQAMFPLSGEIIPNSVGTAPGLLISKNTRYLFAVPGVPYELQNLWDSFIKPFLKQILISEGSPVLTSKLVKMVGIGESAMEEKIIDLVEKQTNPTIAPYASRGEVSLRITAKSQSEIDNYRVINQTLELIKERLGQYIYGYDNENLETAIGNQLKSRGWHLAIAESCTGGLMTHRITNISGSSAYFLGGVNSYSNELKINLLGVPESTIIKHGAVSEETAAAMANGIRKLTGSDVGVGVTGIAGPGGATPDKPVGLIYMAIDQPGYSQVIRRIFPFDRIGNKESAAQAGLTLVWESLIKN